jgi:hypothetical protein
MNKELIVVKIRTPIMETLEQRAKQCGVDTLEYIENLIEQRVLSEKW